MKAFLLHREKDFALDALSPAAHSALEEDLGLDDLFDAMAAGDPFLRDVSRTVVLAGLRDEQEIIYRQEVLRDCIDHGAVVRHVYALAAAAIESERRAWRIHSENPELVLSMSVRTLELLVPMLRQLRRVADEQAESFRSDGFTAMFATLRRELDDDYFRAVGEQLRLLHFNGAVSMNGRLGRRNTATGFELLRPAARSWRDWIPGAAPPGYSIDLAPRDEAGAQVLADLRARGVNLVANTVGQAVDHVVGFFAMLRYELGFYVGCLNLRERLHAIGQETCVPDPKPAGSNVLRADDLSDVCLSLRMSAAGVGTDLDASGRPLIIVTGANQGGKSTFLRGLGLAQIMMQSGLFVAAETFEADVRDGVFTHFMRSEDQSMRSGRFDEELKRFSEIAEVFTPNALALFNESFAASNEREGADIAEGVVRAVLEAGARVVFVTHSYELARRFFEPRHPDALFLRAERLADGRRTFRQVEGEPLPTSYGADLFHRIFPEEVVVV